MSFNKLENVIFEDYEISFGDFRITYENYQFSFIFFTAYCDSIGFEVTSIDKSTIISQINTFLQQSISDPYIQEGFKFLRESTLHCTSPSANFVQTDDQHVYPQLTEADANIILNAIDTVLPRKETIDANQRKIDKHSRVTSFFKKARYVFKKIAYIKREIRYYKRIL